MSLFHPEPSTWSSLNILIPAAVSLLTISLPLILAGVIYRSQKSADRQELLWKTKEGLFERYLEELNEYIVDVTVNEDLQGHTSASFQRIAPLALLYQKIGLYADNDALIVALSKVQNLLSAGSNESGEMQLARRAVIFAMRHELHPRTKIGPEILDEQKA